MSEIIELKNGRPRIRRVSRADLEWLSEEPGFYGEIVRLTRFGAELKRPDGRIEQIKL